MRNSLLKHSILRALTKSFTALSLIVISIIVSLAAAEGFARVYGLFAYERRYVPWDEFRLTIPPPYQTDLYDIYEMISNTKWSFKNGSISEDGSQIRYPDYQSKSLNIVDGIRLTSDRPPHFSGKIYVFGGSTIYSSEVPDEYTIPSYLQRMINATSKNTYAVVNMGMIAVTTTGQYNRLKDVKLGNRDIVVFYDGVNDALQSIYYGVTTGSMVSRNMSQLRTLTPTQKTFAQFHSSWRDKSYFVKYFLDSYNYEMPDHLKNDEQLKKLSLAMKENSSRQIRASHKFVTENGARFVHILQPHLFSYKHFSKYQKRVFAETTLAGFKEGLNIGYSELRELIGEQKKQGIEAFDISDIFGNQATDAEYFLDFAHMAHSGNRVIAEEIYSILRLNEGVAN